MLVVSRALNRGPRFAASLAAVVCSFAAGAAGQDSLRAGAEPVERAIAGGETHTYRIEVAAGSATLIVARQQRIDVVLRASAAGGEPITVDQPLDERADETLLLEPDTATRYELVVSAADGGLPGHYVLRVGQLAPGDERRIAAERAMSRGATVPAEVDAASRAAAVASYVEAAALWRELGDERRLATALYAIGRVHLDGGAALEAREPLSEALGLWQRVEEPEIVAATSNDLGMCLLDLGDSAAGEQHLEAAARAHATNGDLGAEATSRGNLCLRRLRLGELGPARECFEAVLELAERLDDPAFLALTLSNLGGAHYMLGDADPARRYYERSLELYRQLDDAAQIGRLWINLGALHRRSGEDGQALVAYGRALERFERLGNQRQVARLLNNLGSAYNRLGDHRRGLSFFERALPLRRAVGDRRGEAITLSQIGHVRLKLGQPQQAVAFQEEARAAYAAASDRRGAARALRSLAVARAAVGDVAAAREELATAIGELRELEDRTSLASSLRALSLIELEAGDHAAAVVSAKAAEALYARLDEPAGAAETGYLLALAAHLDGQHEVALGKVEASLATLESRRAKIASPDLRATLVAARADAYELLIEVHLALADADPAAGHAEAALAAAERARARSLLDVLAAGGAELHAGADPELVRRHGELGRQLQTRSYRWRRLRRRDDDAAAGAEREVYAILSELERVEAELRAGGDGGGELGSGRSLDGDQIRALLDADTVLVEYALGERQSALWVATTDAIVQHPLPPRATIDALARRAHDELATLVVGERNADSAVAELGALLLGALADHLAAKRLAVVATGSLQYVPFSALAPARDASPLLIEHEVVHLPSASALGAIRAARVARTPTSRLLAVLADPVFTATDPRLTDDPGNDATADLPERFALRSATADAELARLPATRREAAAILAHAGDADTLQLLDFAANKEALTGASVGDYRYLHFATHGVIDAEQPALSGLILSRVDRAGQPVDGFLGVRDVFRLRLGADLVVLSGCQTALGRELRGEGLVGLTRGFLYAGAPAVVASLWRVEDRVTAELMSELYRRLLVEGEAPAAALRGAQLHVRSQRRWRHPYHWAGFVLQGDWR